MFSPTMVSYASTVLGRRNVPTSLSQEISPYATQILSLENHSFPHKSVVMVPLTGILKEESFFKNVY